MFRLLLPYSAEIAEGADPDAKVVGFRVAGDLGGRIEAVLKACLLGKGLERRHRQPPYDAAKLAPLPADRQIAVLRKLMADLGGKSSRFGTANSTIPAS